MPPYSGTLPGTGGLGSDPLSAPPPSPQMGGGGPTGGQPFSMAGLTGPQPIPSTQLGPAILTGILADSQEVGQKLDWWAQIAPDLAPKFNTIKDMLQSVLAELVNAGAGATSATNAGAAFPGGGMDRGIAGAGTV
jgi:hypothetical protein